MQHEPCGFLCDSKSAMQFITANSVFAVHYQPHGGKPLLKSNRRILEHCANLERELLFRMVTIAAVEPRILKVGHLVRATVGAAHLAVRPAHCDHELTAVLELAKELDCLLECFGAFHATNVAEKL